MDSEVLEAVYDEFEKLFNKPDDAVMLDLATITKQPIGDILLDCAMYDDDELFEKSIKLMDRCFGQRRKLLEVLGEAFILDDEFIPPPFDNVHNLQQKVNLLMYIMC